MLSKSFQILNIVFKERYREPTLELIVPTMLVSNIFLSAFYERSGFQLLGIVLPFVPLISVSETLAFALSLRNIIFVTGDHISRGSIIAFLMMPIKREKLFFFMYFCDIVFPYLVWVITTEIYILLSNIQVPLLLLLTYTFGFFFIENLIFLLTLIFRSPGISTLASLFIVGIIFIFGGILNYYELIYNSYSELYLSSFANPYILWINDSLGKNFIPQIITGISIDGILGAIMLGISYARFMVLEI